MLVRSILFAVVTLFLVAPPVMPTDEKVRVSVVAILATEHNNEIDPRLECIACEVRKMHPHLRGFQLGKMSCKSVRVGSDDFFALVGDQTAWITIQHKLACTNRVQLKVVPPLMGEITYSAPCGKFLPIFTPYRTRKNEQLLIAIRVQTCPGKVEK